MFDSERTCADIQFNMPTRSSPCATEAECEHTVSGGSAKANTISFIRGDESTQAVNLLTSMGLSMEETLGRNGGRED